MLGKNHDAPSDNETLFHRLENNRLMTSSRTLPEETPIAISYAGSTHAVMMASPTDLEDFAVGFSCAEGAIASADEIASVETLE